MKRARTTLGDKPQNVTTLEERGSQAKISQAPDVTFEGKFVSYRARYQWEGSVMKVERIATKQYGKSVCGAQEWEERRRYSEILQQDLRAQFVY